MGSPANVVDVVDDVEVVEGATVVAGAEVDEELTAVVAVVVGAEVPVVVVDEPGSTVEVLDVASADVVDELSASSLSPQPASAAAAVNATTNRPHRMIRSYPHGHGWWLHHRPLDRARASPPSATRDVQPSQRGSARHLPMSFGQSTGPPAGHRQMAELLGLLQEAGFDGYRDARGPMGFTQRQGNGKFTSDEADAYIAQLYEEAEHREVGEAAPIPPKSSAAPKSSALARTLRDAPDEALAAELVRRGWQATPPSP